MADLFDRSAIKGKARLKVQSKVSRETEGQVHHHRWAAATF